MPCPKGHEEIWIRRYERHNAEVLDYFRDRSDFIHLRLDESEVNWQNLCGFLGYDVPNQPWPHANQAAEKRQGRIAKNSSDGYFLSRSG